MLPTMADTNQSRLTGMPLKSSQFDYIDPENETEAEEAAEGDVHGEGSGRLSPMNGVDPFTRMASNPAVSAKQQRFMGMCAHSPGKAKGKCPSHDVAEEFSHKD